MLEKRTFRNRAASGLVALMLLAVMTSYAAAQQAHLGPRVGGNFETNDALIGAQLSVPISNWLEFYPSADVYFPSQGTRLGLNGDMKLRFPSLGNFGFYTGGGLSLQHRRLAGEGETDTGLNLLGGLETRVGWIHPFVETRLVWHDKAAVQLMTGINFTLGERRQ